MIKPKCNCHDVVMKWAADKRTQAGGRWICRVNYNEYVMQRRRKRGVRPIKDLRNYYFKDNIAYCKCHDLEMLWHKDKKLKNGGSWRCKIKRSEQDKNWRRSESGRASIKKYLQTDKSKARVDKYYNRIMNDPIERMKRNTKARIRDYEKNYGGN